MLIFNLAEIPQMNRFYVDVIDSWLPSLAARLSEFSNPNLGTKSLSRVKSPLGVGCADSCQLLTKERGFLRNSSDAAVLWIEVVGFDKRVGSHLALTEQHRVTELAALALAILIVRVDLDLSVVEVARRGDSFDYWVGGRPGERLGVIEVSGTTAKSLKVVLDEKIHQVSKSPSAAFRTRYAFVAAFQQRSIVLWQTG
ncbi:MAG: hypothetical protein R2729_30475 [Bryobacteraceae bacterium]